MKYHQVINNNISLCENWGIRAEEADYSIISSNIIDMTGGGECIYAGGAGKRITISGNNCTGSDTFGIYLSYQDNSTVSGNICTGNNNGICLSYSDYNTISGNTTNDNDSNEIWGTAGIYLASEQLL